MNSRPEMPERNPPMDETVPVILGILLGALIWSTTSGSVRFLLSVCAVLVSGLIATVLSGEYHESWIYLLLDLGEAALGLAVGMFIVHRVQRRRAAARATASSVKQGQS
jgi:hypothetical protein